MSQQQRGIIHNLNRFVLEKVLDKDANVVVQYSYTLGAAGDKVWAYNVETGETELKTVLKVYVHSVDEILHLYTDEGNIDTTTNHPFYVIGQGWTAAGDLVEGDEVYNLDGTTSVVLGSVIEKLDECVLVYNLEVEDYHAYFVGETGTLVHNSCTYSRVQGGESGTSNYSKDTISINGDGSININDKDHFLAISSGNEHSAYFTQKRGSGSYTIQFDLPDWIDNAIRESSISQYGATYNVNHNYLPQRVDVNQPGNAYLLPPSWLEFIEYYAINGRIIQVIVRSRRIFPRQRRGKIQKLISKKWRKTTILKNMNGLCLS